MGRKSMAVERTNQILDAFEKCIIKYGFEGATLQRTADAAQVNLGMIHHYIGRKDDLLKSMVARLISRTEEEMMDFNTSIPADQRLPFLLNIFFDDESDEMDKVVESLYVSGSDNPVVQAALDDINRLYLNILKREIIKIHPELPESRCHEIALSVLGLAYGSGLLPTAGVHPEMWRLAAETLINNPG